MVTLFTSLCSGRDIYIAQRAYGLDSGDSCANARAIGWLDVSSNWGTGTTAIAPGDTLHLCGEFHGAANTTLITFYGSGTSGSPITLVFEPGAKLTSPAWSARGAINLNGHSFIALDGGASGVIENTDNGTDKAWQLPSRLLYSSGSDNIEIRQFALNNAYVYQRDSLSDQATADGSAAVILASAGSNISIHHNTATNCGGACIGIDGAPEPSTNWRIHSNTVRQAKWLINASNTRSQSHYIFIYANDIADTDQYWNKNAFFHCNGIIVYGSPRTPATQGTYGYVYVYNNYIHGRLGNPNQTGAMFLSKTTSGPVYIFNNVIRPTGHTPGVNCFSNGWVALQWDQVLSAEVFNNTFDGTAACGYSHRTGSRVSIENVSEFRFVNNIVYDNGGFEVRSPTPMRSDHNVWYGIQKAGRQAFKVGQASWYYFDPSQGAPNWIDATGHDHNSVTTDPRLLPFGKLDKGSSAIGLGENLSRLCLVDVHLAPLCADKDGLPRPVLGPWDAGAYNALPQPEETAPTPPSNLASQWRE